MTAVEVEDDVRARLVRVADELNSITAEYLGRYGVDRAHELVEEAVAAPARQRVVSSRVARHALWHLGDNENWAVQPGQFEQRLFALIDTADEDNRGKLAEVFPEHVIALRDGRKSWGLTWLRSCTEVGL